MSHPLLVRNRLHSDVSSASYDPYTFIEHHPLQDDAENTLLDNPARLFADTIRVDCTLFHEHIHWSQQNATTVGAFLSYLRYSQENTAVQWLLALSSDERTRVIAGRFDANPQPIVGLDKGGNRSPYMVPGSHDLNMLRQIWHDHLLVQTMFYNSALQDTANFKRETVLGEVICDTLLILRERSGKPLNGNEAIQVRAFFTPGDGVVFASVNGERITTCSLMEAHATSSELLNLLHWALGKDLSRVNAGLTFEKVMERVQYRFSVGDYGIPARIFARILGCGLNAWLIWAPTFHLILDLSLNPPLPPLVVEAPGDQKAWSWAELYPPLRFVRLCDAVSKMGLLKIDTPDEKVTEFARILCNRAGVFHWMDFGVFKGRPRQDYDFNRKESYEFLSSSNYSYFDYLVWAQNHLWQRRKSRPGNVHEPNRIKWGKDAFEEALNRIEPERRWARAPFVVSDEGKFCQSTGDSALDAWLVHSSLAHYVIFDILSKTGKIELSAYPTEISDSEAFKNFIRGTLTKLFDVEMSHCI